MTQSKNKLELVKWYRKLVAVKTCRAGLRRLAKNIADAITNKKITPIDGANIMWCIWDRLNKPTYLAPYVGLASEYKDYEFLQKHVERDELHKIITNKVACLADVINYSTKISKHN